MSSSKRVYYIKPQDGDFRRTVLPTNRVDTYKFVTTARNMFWNSNEINLDNDRKDFESLDKSLQHFIKYVLAFFASMDNLINDNIMNIFEKSFDYIIEIIQFYNFQKAMEDIHNESYSLQIMEIIEDHEEKTKLFNSIETMPIIKRIAEWVLDTQHPDRTIGEQLFRTACIEGIMFMGAFCMIFYVHELNGKMKGITQANKLIARDESIHRDFFAHVYNLLEPEYKLSKEKIIEILDEVFEIANDFNKEALEPFEQMAKDTKTEYVLTTENLLNYQKMLADLLLEEIGIGEIYKTTNPFPFMNMMNFTTKTNFFEKTVTEYSKAGKVSDVIVIDDDIEF